MNSLIARLKNLLFLAVIYVFNCFPIKRNKLFLFSYYGSQYGCNPKHITEYILKNCPKGKYDLVWAFNDLKSKEHLTGFRKVRTMSLRYFWELCTAKIVITNFRTTDLFIKRKNQYYIQTWHSSLRLKQIEKDAEELLPRHYVRMARHDSRKCDLLLSGCKYSTDIFKRCFWYNGPIFEHGTPRNDLFFRNDPELRKKIIDQLNLTPDHKIVLYAPTFRNNGDLDIYKLNYAEITGKLQSKFGGDWVALVKLHPHLLAKSGQLVFGDKVIDVTSYDDIQELLSISDVLISDYSSVIFDFSLTRRPCFLYVPDIEDYVKKERQLYFDINHLPFVSSRSNEELLKAIDNYDHRHYHISLTDFLNSIESFEQGMASASLVSYINEVCFSKKRRVVCEQV